MNELSYLLYSKFSGWKNNSHLRKVISDRSREEINIFTLVLYLSSYFKQLYSTGTIDIEAYLSDLIQYNTI